MIDVHRIRADEGMVLKQLRLRALTAEPDAYAERLPDFAMLPNDYWEDLAADTSASPNRVTFLAEFEGRPVGTLAAHLVDLDTVELTGMWTEPLVRRRGAGRRLVNAVEAWATETGACVLELWILGSNTNAQGMYRRCGFELFTESRRPVDSDGPLIEVRMAREL